MKRILIIIAALLPFTGYSQDVIAKKNGQTIRAKVLSVTPTEVSYKAEKSPDGPTFTISKDELLSISYEDGTNTNFVRGNNSTPNAGLAPIQQLPFTGDSIKVDAVNTYKRGDIVLFKKDNGKFKKGRIIGLKPTFAIVTWSGKTLEMPYDQIAKFEDK